MPWPRRARGSRASRRRPTASGRRCATRRGVEAPEAACYASLTTGERAMRRWLMAALASLALAGPAWAQGGSVLRVIPSADITELDPTRGANLVSRIYSQMVFETLFALDSKLAPQPMMLERSERSADGMRWEFPLRPGLRFHNGDRVTARDVVASLERWMGNT